MGLLKKFIISSYKTNVKKSFEANADTWGELKAFMRENGYRDYLSSGSKIIIANTSTQILNDNTILPDLDAPVVIVFTPTKMKGGVEKRTNFNGANTSWIYKKVVEMGHENVPEPTKENREKLCELFNTPVQKEESPVQQSATTTETVSETNTFSIKFRLPIKIRLQAVEARLSALEEALASISEKNTVFGQVEETKEECKDCLSEEEEKFFKKVTMGISEIDGEDYDEDCDEDYDDDEDCDDYDEDYDDDF